MLVLIILKIANILFQTNWIVAQTKISIWFITWSPPMRSSFDKISDIKLQIIDDTYS